MDLADRLIKLLIYLRWRSFDTSTEEGLRDERYRRALLTTAANVLSKSLAMLVLLLSVPLTLPYLGQERFGIWMTISGFTTMLAFLDFGIGNSLLYLVAQAQARSESDTLQRIASNAVLILMLIGSLSGLSLLTVSHFMPWESVIKITTAIAQDELRPSITVFILIFAVSVPLLGIQRVFLGLQEGYVVYLVTAAANAISLVILYVVTQHQSGIPVLLLVTFGIQTIALLLPFFLLIKKQVLVLAQVNLENIKATAPKLLKPGSVFFVLQIGAMIGWGADSLFISSLLGASYVAVFVICQRLFQFVTQPLALLMFPLWATYTDAITRGDKAYARMTLKKSMIFSAGASILLASVLLLFHEWIISQWTGDKIVLPFGLVVGYAIWTVFDSMGITFAMFLNGAGILRPQLLVVLMFSVITLPAKAILLPQVGLSGLIFITITGYILAVVLPYLTFLRHKWTLPLGL